MPAVYSLVRKIHLVARRKEKGLAQADVARAMSVSRSTVTWLEKRLLTGRDVPISSVERYEAAVGACPARERNAVKKGFGFYESAEEALASVVHSSLCEGLVTPPEDIENLLKVAPGRNLHGRIDPTLHRRSARQEGRRQDRRPVRWRAQGLRKRTEVSLVRRHSPRTPRIQGQRLSGNFNKIYVVSADILWECPNAFVIL